MISERRSMSEWKNRWGELAGGLDDSSRVAAGCIRGYLAQCSRQRSAGNTLAFIADPPPEAIELAERETREAQQEKRRMAGKLREALREFRLAMQNAEGFLYDAKDALEVAAQEAGGDLIGQATGYEAQVAQLRQVWSKESAFFSNLVREVEATIENAQSTVRYAFRELYEARHDNPEALALLPDGYDPEASWSGRGTGGSAGLRGEPGERAARSVRRRRAGAGTAARASYGPLLAPPRRSMPTSAKPVHDTRHAHTERGARKGEGVLRSPWLRGRRAKK